MAILFGHFQGRRCLPNNLRVRKLASRMEGRGQVRINTKPMFAYIGVTHLFFEFFVFMLLPEADHCQILKDALKIFRDCLENSAVILDLVQQYTRYSLWFWGILSRGNEAAELPPDSPQLFRYSSFNNIRYKRFPIFFISATMRGREEYLYD